MSATWTRRPAAVDGRLRVTVEHAGRTVELETARRGDVIGEVALFCGKRTADVDAIGDVRLLCLTRANLGRLNRWHPRIASRVFQNLSGILAHRLARETQRVD